MTHTGGRGNPPHIHTHTGFPYPSDSKESAGNAVRNPPATQEAWVRSLGWKDPLEQGTSTHFSILAWRIPWTEEPGGLQTTELQRVGRDRATNTTVTYSRM